MHRTSFAGMSCSLARSLELIGDWWTPLIVRDLSLGISRFDDLVEDLGVSRNLLAARLKRLTAQGLVERRRYQDRPPRYEYLLTQMSRELMPPLLALTAWGDRWASPKEGPPVIYTHRGCGKDFSPAVTCPHCGDALRPEDVAARPGPGGRAGRGTRVVARILQNAARARG